MVLRTFALLTLAAGLAGAWVLPHADFFTAGQGGYRS